MSPHFWVALVSALAVLGVALVDLRGASSGALSMVHESVPELQGSGGCNECHGGWFQSMSEACLECHATIEEHIDEGLGLHGAIDATQAQACALCHSEHHGPTFQPTNVQSFVLAVSAKPEDFDHTLVDWPMAGEHLELGCVECHENADAAPLPQGETRYLGLDRDCAACHEDPHEGALAALACAACHQQEAFDALRFAEHEDSLHLEGGHAELDCRKCHAVAEPHSLEALSARESGAPRTCLACHSSPHAAPFVGGFADSRGMDVGASCLECHQAEHETFRSEALSLSAKAHAFSGFALTPPHDEASCAQCHTAKFLRFDKRYPERGPDDCAACHDDPHGGQFDAGPFAERGCVACHERRRFEPHAFGLVKHARSALELSGAHLEAQCNDCHTVPSVEEPRRFEGTDARCESCHTDAHEGYFDRALSQLEPLPHGSCEHCHVATRFSDAPEQGFDHQRWTGFALGGAHGQVGCEACHLEELTRDRHGRLFGRVSDTFGDFQGCESCHADPHDGSFDFAGLPSDVQGRRGCARCHQESSFRSLFQPFDHGKWTGFALDGAHAEGACAACHATVRGAPQELATGATLPGRSFAPARGRSCAECHASPHGDQFDLGIPVTCESCHAGARGFDDLRFHHDRDTRFRLGEAHRGLACSACHEPGVQNGGGIVRYRGLGRECTDCHGVHTDQLKTGRRGGD